MLLEIAVTPLVGTTLRHATQERNGTAKAYLRDELPSACYCPALRIARRAKGRFARSAARIFCRTPIQHPAQKTADAFEIVGVFPRGHGEVRGHRVFVVNLAF
jgi:hypothetical protein